MLKNILILITLIYLYAPIAQAESVKKINKNINNNVYYDDTNINILQRLSTIEKIYLSNKHILFKLQEKSEQYLKNLYELQNQIKENRYILKKISILINKKNNFQKLKLPSNNDIISNNNINIKNIIHKNSYYKKNIKKFYYFYNQAIQLMNNKKYIQSIKIFKTLLIKYSSSKYIPNVYYWLGKIYFYQNNNNYSQYYFAILIKLYPYSNKTPDAMLNLGYIMKLKGYNKKSQFIFKEIGKLYPTTKAAKKVQKFLISY